MNPFGAWVAGMSSTANPELAAQLGMTAYNNAAQLQGQSDVKMMEMQQKMQDEQLQRQALKSYLKKAGMSEEEANAASMMPSNTLPAMLGAQQGLVTTYDEQGTPTYTRKTEAPGMSGRPITSPTAKRSALDERSENTFLDSANAAQSNIPKYQQALDLMNTGKMSTGVIAGSTVGKVAQKLFSSETEEADINTIDNALADIRTESSKEDRTPGAVSDFETKLMGLASGADTNVSEPQVKKVLTGKIILEELKIEKARLWEQAKQENPNITFTDFKRAWGAGKFDDDPAIAQLKQKFDALNTGSTQPTVTNTKSATGQPAAPQGWSIKLKGE